MATTDKAKQAIYSKRWYEKNIERARETARRQYAKASAKNESIFESIAGRPRAIECEVCGRRGASCSKRFNTVFDHDHATGKFRGWLCNKCNTVLGKVDDKPELLRKLASYLESGGIGPGPAQSEVDKVVNDIELQTKE